MASNSGYIRTNNEELRIMLVGRTGTGKSVAINTILGRQHFKSKYSPWLMILGYLKPSGAVVAGQQVVVTDTPLVLFDTTFDEESRARFICQCISDAAPGPHVFLVVIRLGRFTIEDRQIVQRIQEIFGQAAYRYCMVLFTHGDLLHDTTIEEFLVESSELQELVARCNGQYHVFNNDIQGGSQVTELLQKIRNVVQRNGGSHYTNEMFQEAERKNIEEKKRILGEQLCILEEEDRILREKEKQIQKEREELERKLEKHYEEEMNYFNAQLRAEREERERKAV